MTTLTIAMNGVTGRMGRNQHLERSLAAIRAEGGLTLADGSVVWPELVLVGRNEAKLQALAEAHGIERWSTDLDTVLSDPDVDIYFDSQVTRLRADAVARAIDAGKAVYCEKPLAERTSEAIQLARRAQAAGVRNGIVQDKLFLPGLRKLRRLIDSGFFGRILSIRGDFGYWVFEGFVEPGQRPSWNYRAEDGGGIILDMFPHWQYVIEDLFAPIRRLACLGTTHVPERIDETGAPYAVTADDAAYAIFELDDGAIAQINSSWATRVYRDELVMFQVDGTEGSAVAGLRGCRVQPRSATPRPVWNPDLESPMDFRSTWLEVPDIQAYDNGFKVQWEHFLRHVALEEPFPWDFAAGARGSQIADLGIEAWQQGRFVDAPEVTV